MTDKEGMPSSTEIVISERVYSRLQRQVILLYVASVILAVVIGGSLAWEYRVVSELTESRLSEYRLLVADKLEELHRLDLDEVALRTRPREPCAEGLPEEDAERLLEVELERPPHGNEVDQLLDRAEAFGICDIGEVRHILEDPVNRARVETVYQVLLGRQADPIGRFIYGYWLASGMDVSAVARDIMTSPEFMKLKALDRGL